MIDEFIYKYRFLIGGILTVIILTGVGILIYQKINQNAQKENTRIIELQKQNDLLRQELSSASQQVAGVQNTTSQKTGDIININTADLAELDKLPGIGPAIGQRIIDWRTQNNNFKTIEDVKNVKGIGDATFEKMKDMITVGE